MDKFLRAREPAGPAGESPGADFQSLLSLLGRLLTRIGSSGNAGSTNGSAVRPADRWEDDAYIYLEAILPDIRDRDVDISVHDGKVLIRMEK